MAKLPVISDRVMAIDAAAALAVSAGIVAATNELVFMSLFVPAVLVARTLLLAPHLRREWGFGLGTELLLLAGCTLVGAFNDWNSVVRHGVYAYHAPTFFPEFTTIPEWMLLFWGFILRSLVTLFRWERLQPPVVVSNASRLAADNAALRIGLQFALILVTRQAIYRLYEDPVWSWAPFAAALALYAVLLTPRRYELKVGLGFLIAGPLIEAAYIQYGGLHDYRLGWFLGVPLWIALWWVLAVLIWSDLSARILRRIAPSERDEISGLPYTTIHD